jgi:hypothetical protein
MIIKKGMIKLIVGMLHHQNKPEKVMYATELAKELNKYGGTLLFFNPKMIDYKHQVIRGYLWMGEEWSYETIHYPDVIYLSVDHDKLAQQDKQYRLLLNQIPYLAHKKGEGMRVYKRIPYQLPQLKSMENIKGYVDGEKVFIHFEMDTESIYKTDLYGSYMDHSLSIDSIKRTIGNNKKVYELHCDKIVVILLKTNQFFILNLKDIVDQRLKDSLEEMALLINGRRDIRFKWMLELNVSSGYLEINLISNLIYNTFLLINEYTVNGECLVK